MQTADTYELAAVARLPMPGDNTAIATRRLEAGERVTVDGHPHPLSHTVLEGHRFAVRPIRAGERLLSWNLPFGTALQPIEPGTYVCNERTLHSLRLRSVRADLPDQPNFADSAVDYHLHPATFQPAPPPSAVESPPSFWGFQRSPARGVDTRNFIVLLGTSSATGSFVRALEERLQGLAKEWPNLDGIVAAAHTEGSVPAANNHQHVLRTLAGFLVHPNVGAVLAVDAGWEPINNTVLRTFLSENGYPIDDTLHAFMSLEASFEETLQTATAHVLRWLEPVNATPRTLVSAAHLKVALQCGGSDAFSGISANPLIGWAAHHFVRCGGYANIAETPELIGAEPYMLAHVKDLATAERYLAIRQRFIDYAAAHDTSAEGNPSDGNKFRGLYNIILKSIGAAQKKHPETRLDGALDYSERMPEPGFYFMDTPGLDLESVAGQVASGCTVIYFTTGNGSVTNFPFVPTLKIVTTTPRFELLSKDMDVNAGAYLDGVPMEQLGLDLVERTLRVASGERTTGELAGHAQVQIWRNWRQQPGTAAERPNTPRPDRSPLPVRLPVSPLTFHYPALAAAGGPVFEQVGMVIPTSLCAAQVARLAAERLNRRKVGLGPTRTRYVSLVHTEGCSDATGAAITMSAPTLLGYATHPMVERCLLLEHGCEVMHNDFMRRSLGERGCDLHRFGWASVQLDGGIAQVLDRIEHWFRTHPAAPAHPADGSLATLRIGLVATAPLPPAAARSLAHIATAVAAAGGTVVAAESGYLPHTPTFIEQTLLPPTAWNPSLAYAEQPVHPGFHIMATPTDHPVEILTGLGATGIDAVLAYVGAHPIQGHPLVPVLELAADCPADRRAELDLFLSGDDTRWADQILERLGDLASHRSIPQRLQLGNIDFQIARGLMGISL